MHWRCGGYRYATQPNSERPGQLEACENEPPENSSPGRLGEPGAKEELTVGRMRALSCLLVCLCLCVG